MSAVGKLAFEQVRRVSGTLLLLFLALSLGACQPQTPAEHATSDTTAAAPTVPPDTSDALVLTFLDVGQGDAVLIESPSGQRVLYDGGPRAARVLDQLQALGVDSLNLVVASHPHEDHIGGLSEVIRHYQPPFVIDNGLAHTTRTYERYLEAIEEAGSQLLDPTERSIALGEAELNVVPPPQREDWGHNDNSVGVVVSYGSFRAFLGGDAEEAQQAWWLEAYPGALQPVQVHKASHHGSRNGDTEAALERLRPQVVVIGVGEENGYGHPHAEALARYEEVGAAVYRTDRHSAVAVAGRSDGTFEVFPSRGEDPPEEESGEGTLASCVDVNSAPPDELERIIHIGPRLAEAVVAARPFASVDSLTRVRGIGPRLLEEIRSQGLACAQEPLSSLTPQDVLLLTNRIR